MPKQKGNVPPSGVEEPGRGEGLEPVEANAWEQFQERALDEAWRAFRAGIAGRTELEARWVQYRDRVIEASRLDFEESHSADMDNADMVWAGYRDRAIEDAWKQFRGGPEVAWPAYQGGPGVAWPAYQGGPGAAWPAYQGGPGVAWPAYQGGPGAAWPAYQGGPWR